MQNSKDHEQQSIVHQQAIASGVQVFRKVKVDGNLTLIEYSGAKGCYAYFASLPGSFRIPLAIDDVVKIWADEKTPLLMARAGLVMLG